MSKVEELEERIKSLEKRLARQNRSLLDIPKEKYPGFVCGTTDIKNGVRNGKGMFRFKMIDVKDLNQEKMHEEMMKKALAPADRSYERSRRSVENSSKSSEASHELDSTTASVLG